MAYRPKCWKNPFEEIARTDGARHTVQLKDGATMTMLAQRESSECYEAGADAMLAALMKNNTPCEGRIEILAQRAAYRELLRIINRKGSLIFIPEEEQDNDR